MVAPLQGGHAGFGMRQRAVALLAAGARRGKCSGTAKDNNINQPQRAVVMGWQACQSEGYAFCCDIIPHLFFFEVPGKQSITKMSSCEKKSRKPENSKLMLIL